MPTAVVGAANDEARGKAFLDGMEKALDASLKIHTYDSGAAAVEGGGRAEGLRDPRRAGAGTRGHARRLRGVRGLGGAGAGGGRAGGRQETGVAVTVTDIKPLQKGDPRGLAIFYISLAAVIIGFVGAIQLSVHARALNPLERIAFTAAYALLGGLRDRGGGGLAGWARSICRSSSPGLILALTMFTSGMVFTMFNTLFGRWAMIPTWGLMVLLGNPSSGGAVSWPLLPSVLGRIGRWLPPGASVNAQHTAVYFGGHQHVFPFLVLAAWALVSSAVFWIWRHRASRRTGLCGWGRVEPATYRFSGDRRTN